MNTVLKIGLIGLKVLLSAFFLFAAYGKFTGEAMVVGVFDQIGWGDWFRYFAGAVQVTGVLLLWVPGRQVFGGLLLAGTMAGAVMFHILVLGPSLVPALVAGLLAATVAFAHRDQILGR